MLETLPALYHCNYLHKWTRNNQELLKLICKDLKTILHDLNEYNAY